MPSVIAQNASTESTPPSVPSPPESRKPQLTDNRNNLRLKSVLVAEATGNVRDTSSSVVGNVWNPSYVVEHVAAGKEHDGNQGDGRPYVARLDNRLDCLERKLDENAADDNGRGRRQNLDVVVWPYDFDFATNCICDPRRNSFGRRFTAHISCSPKVKRRSRRTLAKSQTCRARRRCGGAPGVPR